MARETAGSENRFDRTSWLVLGVVVVFTCAALAVTLAILALPTDGWQFGYNDPPPPTLLHFAGGWPTPLRAGDRVIAAGDQRIGGGETVAPLPDTGWQDGQTIPYTILRDGRRQVIDVTLHRLDAAGIWRSFWFTMKDTPTEWSWSLIAILVFAFRPRSAAARLMLLAFVPHNVTTKLVWAAVTVSREFAPAPVFLLYQWITFFWGYLFFPSIILLALAFPRPVFPLNRWPRAVPALVYGVPALLALLIFPLRSMRIADIILVGQAAMLLFAFGSAVAGARRNSPNAVARAQALWVLFGFVLSILPILILYLLDSFGVLRLETLDWFYSYFAILLLPTCLAIAITRYHLFDIYLIVRRTLQYTLLSGLLAVLYFGGVILLQGLFSALAADGSTGRAQDLAIVLSTLTIAALFTPLRVRLQQVLDRRFFRSKYNTEQVLAGFAARARSEVDMAELTTALVGAMQDTVQPSSVQVWVKQESRH